MARTTRVDDGFYSTYVLRPASQPLTSLCIRLRVAPNTITVASLVIALIAAGLLATGHIWGYVAGALLLQVSIIVDCVDGDVARATDRMSPLGAWLDAATDRLKEGIVYGGLAWGAATQGVDLWLLALALLALQTVRHVSDYTFVATRQPADTAPSKPSLRHWLRKIAYLPIGERWLILSVGVILGGPTLALRALLVASLISFAFSTVQRIRRTGARPLASGATEVVARQTDFGPVLMAVKTARPTRWSWMLPPILRSVEYAVVILLAWPLTAAGRAAAFAWLIVVTFHHYDVMYRAIQGRGVPRWITLSGLGWEGRTIVLLIAFALTWTFPVFAVGAAWGGLLFIIIASVQWIRLLKESSA